MSTLSDAYATIWDGQLNCFDADTVTLGGIAYACDAGEFLQTTTRIMEGLIDEPSCLITVKTSLFTAAPTVQSEATYRGKTYKIASISTPPDQTVYVLRLEPKMKR